VDNGLLWSLTSELTVNNANKVTLPNEDGENTLTGGEWTSYNTNEIVFANNALQVVANGTGFGFDWNAESATQDIADFGGICVVYSLSGSDMRMNLGDDAGKGVFGATLPEGSYALNIPWESFSKEYGGIRIAQATAASAGLRFVPVNQEATEQVQFSLVQLGKLNACDALPTADMEFSGENKLNLKPKSQDQFSPGLPEAPQLSVLPSLSLKPALGGVTVSVQGADATVSVFNVQGKSVLPALRVGAGTQFVSLESLESGIYFVNARQGSVSQTMRMSK
jgi:hypothetical protein